MAYLDKIVKPGETLLISTRPHWVIYLAALPPLLLAIALAVVAKVWVANQIAAVALYIAAALFAALAVVTFVGRWIQAMTTEYAVTSQRIIVKRGLFSLHTIEMNVDKVESVDVDQTVLGRMMGFGAVTIHGIGARWDPIPQISDPLAFRNAITVH